jgi:hypothetical protein
VSSDATFFDNKCFDMTEAQLAAFADYKISFQVPGVNLVLPYQNYLLKDFGVNGAKGQFCLAIAPTGQQGLMIVGDTLMKDYVVGKPFSFLFCFFFFFFC